MKVRGHRRNDNRTNKIIKTNSKKPLGQTSTLGSARISAWRFIGLNLNDSTVRLGLIFIDFNVFVVVIVVSIGVLPTVLKSLLNGGVRVSSSTLDGYQVVCNGMLLQRIQALRIERNKDKVEAMKKNCKNTHSKHAKAG